MKFNNKLNLSYFTTDTGMALKVQSIPTTYVISL